jgi:hypothetical protein
LVPSVDAEFGEFGSAQARGEAIAAVVGDDLAQQRIDHQHLVDGGAHAFMELVLAGDEGAALLADEDRPALQNGNLGEIVLGKYRYRCPRLLARRAARLLPGA